MSAAQNRAENGAGTEVEKALRRQGDVWREITERGNAVRELLPTTLPRRVIIFGVGSSHYAARLAVAELARGTRESHELRSPPVVAAFSTEIGQTVMPEAGDWAIAITHRGSTEATNSALRRAQQRGAVTIQVSAQGVTCPHWSQALLETSERETCEPHTKSMTGAICAVTNLVQPKLAQYWLERAKAYDPDALMREAKAAQEKVARHAPVLLLGEGAGEWIAREAGLKVMEMAHVPVRVFNTEEYRHGPWYSTVANDRTWITGSQDSIDSGAVLKAYDGPLDESMMEIFGYDPAVALDWLKPLAALQWRALALALSLDVNPDG